MSGYVLVAIIIMYLLVLFLLAYLTEYSSNGKKIAKHPVIYTLSLAVYCSAWTYYGSVGIAAHSGVSYLTTYLGPIIAFPLWMIVMKKVMLITKHFKISTLADFIALRYGNSRSLGALVTAVCLVSIVPYISLQMKAVSETFQIMVDPIKTDTSSGVFSTFFIALILAVFAAFFSTQTSDASSKKHGIVVATAFESIIKLFFFLIIGTYVVFFLFNGTTDIYEQISVRPGFEQLITLNGLEASFNWTLLIIVSFFAIFLLPRQFQMGIIESSNPNQIKTASWLFPLYLLLFNVFVIYIAWAGVIKLGDSVNSDYYSLYLPISQGKQFLSILVFLGGFSASVSMIVVSSLALSTMVSNNLVIPYGFLKRFSESDTIKNTQYIKNIRRWSIFILIIIAYIFYINFNVSLSLVSIGLISFVLIAQLAPAFFLGISWNRATRKGAKTGIIIGVFVACYTIIYPFISTVFLNNTSVIENGPWGIDFLRPYQLMGIDFLEPIPHAFFWSMLANIFSLLVVSLMFKGSYRERNYAEMFVNINGILKLKESGYVWKGKAYVNDIVEVLERFLGKNTIEKEMETYKSLYNDGRITKIADAGFIHFSERLLAGRIGAAASKIAIEKVIEEEPISLTEVLEILKESKQKSEDNIRLKKQSAALSKLSRQLQLANSELQLNDKKKDEFLDIVAHELKTPITSIKLAAEMLQDEDMPRDIKLKFIDNVNFDADRLATLVFNILDLEKLSSGKIKLDLQLFLIHQTIRKAVKSTLHLLNEKNIEVVLNIPEKMEVFYDESRIIQVFVNLLSNASKFVPNKQGIIMINAEDFDEYTEISVTDNGKGIRKEDEKYIFDKFFQSHDQTSKKPNGSGLGLAICEQIIHNHKGEIFVDLKYEKGARIVIQLPKNLSNKKSK